MSKYGSNDVAFFFVDGFELKGDLTEFDLKEEAALEESHGLGDSWREQSATGVRMVSLTQNGFYDDAADAVNTALSGLQQTLRAMLLGVAGNAIGRACTGFFGGFGAKYTRLVSRGELHKATAEYKMSGAKDEAVILQHDVAKTADWNTEGADSVDQGASSANGGVGYLQVPAFTGFSGFVAKIRHSADDVVYADLITFSNVTAGPTAQRVEVAGTVNRHLAVDGNVTGSGSLRAVIAFARAA